LRFALAPRRVSAHVCAGKAQQRMLANLWVGTPQKITQDVLALDRPAAFDVFEHGRRNR